MTAEPRKLKRLQRVMNTDQSRSNLRKLVPENHRGEG
jgi:hypothetical protein